MVRCSVSHSEYKYAAINPTTANLDRSSFVFSSVGYGAGVALYIIFGIFATFSGWAIWKVYLDLDSSRYPMMSYGDPFFRLFGKRSRHFINVAQSLQQFLTVAVLILSKSTNIAQISKGHVCFSAIMVIILGIGMLSGIIRSLAKIGWLSNAAVFMNIANFLIIMVAAASYKPLYSAVTRSTLIKTIEPVVVFAGQPPNQYQQQVPGFASQFNAVNTMVCKYPPGVRSWILPLTPHRRLRWCSPLRCFPR